MLFSDCEPASDPRSRPWRQYWPPTGGGKPAAWAKSEFPSVSTWRFDPRLPFERPWRYWTRTLQAREETANVTRGESNVFPADTPDLHSAPEVADFDKDHGQSGAAARHLDAAIVERGMDNVGVATFSYLSPHQSYESEKPYLSRLPSLPGFLRTNIVGGTRSTRVHEITGNEDLCTLDASGFEFAKWHHSLRAWNEATVSTSYLPSLGRWLKDHLSCSEVHIYAYNVCRSIDDRLSW